MRCRLAVVAVFTLSVGCSSYELAAVGPAAALDARVEARAPATTPADVWTDAVLPTEPVLVSSAPTQEPATWMQHVSLFIGRRNYSDGNLDQNFAGGGELNLQHSGFKGLETDGCNPATGNGYEFGIAFAYQTDSEDGGGPGDYELTTDEIYGGFRHTFRTDDSESICRPYAAVGLEVIRAHFDSPGFAPFDDDASALAAYGRLGVTWELGQRMRMGLDFRQLVGTNDMTMGTPVGTSNADTDNQQVAFTLGYML
jgi:hypothetical protein